MILKNSFFILLLLFCLPCLGFEPMIGYDGFSDSDGNLETHEKALHDKYAVMIDNAITNKQDLNRLRSLYDPLLINVCMHGFNNLAKKMLAAGADIEIQNTLGESPLTTAVIYGKIQTVKLLLEYHADAENKHGSVLPLIRAASCTFHKGENNISIVQLLLNAGANINAQDRYSCTALHSILFQYSLRLTSFEIRTAIVKLLIEYGADLNIKNNINKTPLDFAQENFPELVPVMLKATEIR